MMKTLLCGLFLCAAVISIGFGWPDAYLPAWAPGDTWSVVVKYQSARPKSGALVPADGPVPAYPYHELFEYLQEEVTYKYEVKAVGSTYTYKPPLFDPFVSRPGQPNVESNQTEVTVIDVLRPAGRSDCSNWTLTFDTSTLALLEIREQGDTGELHANPYGQDAWLTFFNGSRHVILDFPFLPSGGTNQTRVLKEMPQGGNPFTQTVQFGPDSTVVTLSRQHPTHKVEQKATFLWEKGKKWWSSAKVELGTNTVVSAALVENQP